MPVVEPELALLQMQFEGLFGNAVELHQSSFGKTPKGLNPIDVMSSPDESIPLWGTEKSPTTSGIEWHRAYN